MHNHQYSCGSEVYGVRQPSVKGFAGFANFARVFIGADVVMGIGAVASGSACAPTMGPGGRRAGVRRAVSGRAASGRALPHLLEFSFPAKDEPATFVHFCRSCAPLASRTHIFISIRLMSTLRTLASRSTSVEMGAVLSRVEGADPIRPAFRAVETSKQCVKQCISALIRAMMPGLEFVFE